MMIKPFDVAEPVLRAVQDEAEATHGDEPGGERSVVALGAVYFFDDPQLGWVIAVAMIATILIGAIAGSLLPTLLRRMNIDPAIAGGVVLTTNTDVAGFFIFLGLASWVYL